MAANIDHILYMSHISVYMIYTPPLCFGSQHKYIPAQIICCENIQDTTALAAHTHFPLFALGQHTGSPYILGIRCWHLDCPTNLAPSSQAGICPASILPLLSVLWCRQLWLLCVTVCCYLLLSSTDLLKNISFCVPDDDFLPTFCTQVNNMLKYIVMKNPLLHHYYFLIHNLYYAICNVELYVLVAKSKHTFSTWFWCIDLRELGPTHLKNMFQLKRFFSIHPEILWV